MAGGLPQPAAMRPRSSFTRRVLVAWLLALLPVAPGVAQNILLTDYKGTFHPVVKVDRMTPMIQVDGKLVSARNARYALHQVEEFMPVFIAIRDIKVQTRYLELMDSSSILNNEFTFGATFESPFTLDDVFVVLELDLESAGKLLYLQEVGRLEARKSKWFSSTFAMHEKLGEGHYQVHLFVGGREVFHSEQPALFRAGMLDRMVLKRINSLTDANPQPLVGPAPEYPKALRKSGVKGEAVVKMHITARGVVEEPVVESASDSAFGEAAVAAVRQWRFLPKVKAGRPVEAVAKMPFEFEPPPK